jgi:glycosyltransferase involved in cell wall biosynthesis
MRDGSRVAVVVRGHNESLLIGRTLRSVPPWVNRIVVVDDGSTDGTADGVRAIALGDPRVRLLAHERNRGVGAALVTGYRAAFGDGADVVAVMAGTGRCTRTISGPCWRQC